MDTQANLEGLLIGDVSQEQAGPMLEQLRAARIAGQVDERAYTERALYLATRAEGGEAAAPVLFPTQEQRLEQGLAEAMKPGEMHEYRLPVDPMAPFDEAGQATDGAMREALSAAGIPATWGGTFVERMNDVERTLGSLSDEERAGKVESVRLQMKERWGADTQANAELIDAFVAKAAEKDPVIAEIYCERPWLLADPWIAESLLTLAKHRQRK